MSIGGLPSIGHSSVTASRVPQCSMLLNGLELTSSFVVALFLLPLCCDFILVWVLAVVCIVLRINFCLYKSPFSSCSGQSFSVLVHVCSSSPGKEVRSSLCQGVALLCGSKRRSCFP